MRYCERCGMSEEEYGFEFTCDCQGEWMCEDCAEESNEEWKNMDECSEKKTNTKNSTKKETFK